MNVYFVAKSNGSKSYVQAADEAQAKKVAVQGDKPGTTATRVTFIKKA